MTSDILIIEDDQRMAAMLAEYLALDGFSSTCIHTVQDFYEQRLHNKDLVLLDLMLGQDSGFELLKKIRQISDIPIIVVSAKKDDSDKLMGFRLGADDYLTKPYNHLELVARIQAVLKRVLPAAKRTHIKINNLDINQQSQAIHCNNVLIDLTALEYRIFSMLLDKIGDVVKRENIYKAALQQSHEFNSRALDVHISNLRKKLGSYKHQEQIKTIRGQGYTLLDLGQ